MTHLLILLAVYFGLLALLSRFGARYRHELVAMAPVLRNTPMSAREREYVDGLLASAYSWRGAIMVSIAFLAGLFQAGSTLDREYEQYAEAFPFLASDPFSHRLREAYFASIFAVNPLFGMLAIVLRGLFRLKARMHHSAKAARMMTEMVSVAVAV